MDSIKIHVFQTFTFIKKCSNDIHVCLLVLLCSSLYLQSNGYTFRGSNCHFHCCLSYNWGHLIKKKTFLPLEQILSFKRRPFLREDFDFQESKQEVTNNVYLRKHGDVPIHLESSERAYTVYPDLLVRIFSS